MSNVTLYNCLISVLMCYVIFKKDLDTFAGKIGFMVVILLIPAFGTLLDKIF